MLSERNVGGGGNVLAAATMFLSVVLFSGQPLVVAWAGGSSNPFLFNAGWRLGLVLGGVLFLVVLYRPLLRDARILELVAERALPIPRVWRAVGFRSGIGADGLRPWTFRRQLVRWAILLSVVGNLDFGFFALSSRYVDISVTALIFEIWPIFMIYIVSFVAGAAVVGGGPGGTEDGRRYERLNVETFLLLAIGFMGVGFITVSQLGGFERLLILGEDSLWSLFGVALAFASAFLTSLSGLSLRWSMVLGQESLTLAGRRYSIGRLEIFYVVVAFVLSNVVSVLLNAFVGILAGESVTLRTLLLSVIVGGALIQATGNVLWRLANLWTINLALNSISYLTPCMSLGLLWLFSYVHVGRGDYLVIGGVCVVAVNVLVNFRAEDRWGFKALVMALSVFGAVVYSRDAVFEYFGAGDWHWQGSTGYFEALALSATVFTLLLAFRVARLVSRTREEDNRTFKLFRSLEDLSRRRVVRRDVLDSVVLIDTVQGRALMRAYAEVRKALSSALSFARVSDREKLIEVQAELDAVVHSRQQAINFGELASLFIFAGITVVLTLAGRPEAGQWGSFFIDLFAMLLSTVVVFLTVNVLDLQSDRNAAVLAVDAESHGFGVKFEDDTDRSTQRWVSVLAGLGVGLAYAGLLGHKWLGWFTPVV